MSWDSSEATCVDNGSGKDCTDGINNGRGINQWGESKYADGTAYEGADLMQLLNGYYIGKEDATCRYCNEMGGTCNIDCSSSIKPLSNTALNMIENAVWSTRSSSSSIPNNVYEEELYDGSFEKTCSATNDDDTENPNCNDTVIRTSDWVGKVGLPYISDWFDYGDNSSNSCDFENYSGANLCSFVEWLKEDSTFAISPHVGVDGVSASYVYSLDRYNILGEQSVYAGSVRPTVYLKTNIKFVDGNGNDQPYILGL